MKVLLNLVNRLFMCLTLLWLFFAIRHPYLETENFDESAVGFLTWLALLVIAYYLTPAKAFIQRGYQFLLKQKKWLLLVVFLFQLYLLFTAVALPIADVTIIHSFGIGKPFSDLLDYISINPNNFSLVIWFKFLHFFVGTENLIFALAFFNILFIDASILLLYDGMKKLVSQKQADILYILFVLIFGLSPQFLYTYSDSITLFLVSVSIYFAIELLGSHRAEETFKYAIYTGLALGLTANFRVPVLIYLIAAVLVFGVFLLRTSPKLDIKAFWQKEKKKIVAGILLLASTLVMVKGNDLVMRMQNTIPYDASKNRSLSYYFDLGLTYTGSDHAALPEDILKGQLPPEEAKTRIQEDIAERLDEYKENGNMLNHLLYKFNLNVAEGMFGWARENVLLEKEVLSISWLHPILQSDLAKETRKFVYSTGEHYSLYPLIMQLVWCLIVVALVFYARYFQTENYFMIWMQVILLGGLLFLMIFEGGRSRYLIQFLPAILILASQGLTNLSENDIISKRIGE